MKIDISADEMKKLNELATKKSKAKSGEERQRLEGQESRIYYEMYQRNFLTYTTSSFRVNGESIKPEPGVNPDKITDLGDGRGYNAKQMEQVRIMRSIAGVAMGKETKDTYQVVENGKYEMIEPKKPNGFKRFMNKAFGGYKDSCTAYTNFESMKKDLPEVKGMVEDIYLHNKGAVDIDLEKKSGLTRNEALSFREDAKDKFQKDKNTRAFYSDGTPIPEYMDEFKTFRENRIQNAVQRKAEGKTVTKTPMEKMENAVRKEVEYKKKLDDIEAKLDKKKVELGDLKVSRKVSKIQREIKAQPSKEVQVKK